MHSKSIFAVAGVAGLASAAAIDRRQLPGVGNILGGGGSPLDSVSGIFGGGSGGGPLSVLSGGGGGGGPLSMLGGSNGGGFNPLSSVSGLTSGLGGLGKRDNEAKPGSYDPRSGLSPFGLGLPGGSSSSGPLSMLGGGGGSGGPLGILGGSNGGGFNPLSMVSGFTSGLGGLGKREEQAKADAQGAQKGQDAQDSQHWDNHCSKHCSQYCQKFLFDQVDQCTQLCPQQCQQVSQTYGQGQGQGQGQGGFGDDFGGLNGLSDLFNAGPKANQPLGDGNDFAGVHNNNNNFPGQGADLRDPASQAFCNIFDQLSGQPNFQGDQDNLFGNQGKQQQSQCPLWQNQGGNPSHGTGRPFGGLGGGLPAGSGNPTSFSDPTTNLHPGGFGNNNGFGSPLGGLGPQARPQGYGKSQ